VRPVLDEPALAEGEPLCSPVRDRLRVAGPLALEPLLGLAQPGAAALAAGQVLGQLVAAGGTVDVVLGGVDPARLLEDLAGDVVVAAERLVGSVRPDFRAVDRDQAGGDEPGVGAQPKHLREELRQGLLVADAEAGDRGVVRHLARGDHAEGDVLAQAALDRPGRALADRVGVDDERDHHLRVVGRAAVAVPAIGGVEAAEVERLDRLDHEPGEVVLVEPLAQVRGQQHRLLSVTAKEVLAHRPPRRSGTLGSSRSGQTKRACSAGLCDRLA
jgi:hypothetical protein